MDLSIRTADQLKIRFLTLLGWWILVFCEIEIARFVWFIHFRLKKRKSTV